MTLKLSEKILILLMHVISKTWRFKFEGDFPAMPAVIAFWHGEMLPCWKVFGKYSPKAVVSQSKDGEILSTLLNKWGFEVLRGSSSKGGKEVLEMMTENVKNSFLLITPDGPRGPIQKFKPGAVITAKRAEVPLVLCRAKIENKYVFKKSWDNFQFPLPFSSIKICFSQNFYINNSLDRKETEDYILRVESELNSMLND